MNTDAIMKKVVRGNDFTLVAHISRIVDFIEEDIPLLECTDVKVSLNGAYKKHDLKWRVVDGNDSLMTVNVDGDALGVGTYNLEVTGKWNNEKWRCYLCNQVQIVNCNCEAATCDNAVEETAQ